MSYPIPEGTMINVPGLPSMTITQLHMLMNRCDVSKDAKEKPSALDSSLFLSSANSLFPIPIKGFKSVLDLIEHGIMDNKFLNKSLGTTRSIPCIRSDPINYLGNTYIYGAQDSGYKYSDINPVMKQILTPGSFSDPAQREKDGILEPYNKTSVGNILNYLGFDQLSYESEFTNGLEENGKHVSQFNTICNINLTGSINGNAIKLNENRNYDHNHSGNDIDYFGGNTEKNTWLNNSQNKNKVNEANLYVLAKLLGDTMQVVFIYNLFQNNNDTYNSTNTCLFTTDNVVETRCKLLGIPVCKQGESENKGKADILKEKLYRNVLFTQPILDPVVLAYSQIYLFREESLTNNRKIIVSLRAVMLDRQVGVSSNIYQFNDETIRYITRIVDAIDSVNNFILEQLPEDRSGVNPNDEIKFKNMMMACRASILIKDYNPKKGFVINTGVNKLFPSEIKEYLSLEIDIIGDYRKNKRGENFSVQIQRTGASLQRGGNKYKEIIGGDSIDSDVKEEAIRLSRKFFYMTYEENQTFIEFLVYNGIGIDDNDSYFEFFLFIIPYFRFIGETCYDVDAIKVLYNDFFLKDDEIATSYKSLVNWYVNNVINPREVRLAMNGVPVVDSDQRIYLSEYGINTQQKINELFMNSEVRIREQLAEDEQYRVAMDKLSREAAINIATQPVTIPSPSVESTNNPEISEIPMNIQTGIKRERDEIIPLEEPPIKKSLFAFGGKTQRKRTKQGKSKKQRKTKSHKKSRKNKRTRRNKIKSSEKPHK